jgi:hypothetical protein
MGKTLSVFLISGTMSAAFAMAPAALPQALAAPQPQAAVAMHAQAEAQVPPRPSGRHPAIRNGAIPGPAISGYGVEQTVQILGGSGYTPGGWVFEGDWTGTAWSGYSNVRADSQGDIGTNWFTEGDCDRSFELYGYDWTTGAFTPPVGIEVNCIP